MVYVLLGSGFEEMEAIAPVDLLRRAGIPTTTVGVDGKLITGGHGITVEADIEIGEMDLTDLEMIVLPGGLGGVATARSCPAALDALRFAWENDKFVAAICAGPTVLADLGITSGRKTTCYPGCEVKMADADVSEAAPCVRDGKLITGASAGCAIPFGLMLIDALRSEADAKKIAAQIVIR
jgi:4-methyl-5(b-hydroxyethyl)-thiazole monophosphate biosynthesis